MSLRLAVPSVLVLALFTPALASAQDLPPAPTTRPAARNGPSEIHFAATPLSDCITFLANISDMNLVVDWRALDAAKVSKDTPITLDLNGNVSIRKALQLVLRQAAGINTLTFYSDDGVIQITSQEAEDRELITKSYPIQDLLFQAPDYTNAPSLDLSQNNSQQAGGSGSGSSSSQNLFSGNTQLNTTNTDQTRAARAQDIINLITTSVRPDVWQVNGGTATITFFRDRLIIRAPRSVHEALSSNLR